MFNPYKLMIIFFLSSCSDGGGYLEQGKAQLTSMTIRAETDMNDNAATPLDLVVAHDDAVFSELMKLTASDYFIRKQQILRDNTGLLEVMSFEVIPGQTLPDIPVNISTVNARGAVIFANYNIQGDHRFRLGSQQKLLIRMKNLNLELDPDS